MRDARLRRVTCDSKEFRAEQLVHKTEYTRGYEVTPEGVQTLTALLALRNKVIKPLLAAASPPLSERELLNPTPIDQRDESLRSGMRNLSPQLGIAA